MTDVILIIMEETRKIEPLFIILAFMIGVQCDTVDNSNLLQVNLLYRHGDRSPVTSFPTDPNTPNWPNGLGWLSKIGMNQHYNLGKWIRKRYDGYLNSSYIHSEILVTSSDEDRCLMSAESNLAGLYPPNQQQTWNPSLAWQPIPVHTKPKSEDKKLNMGDACPAYTQLYLNDIKSPRNMAKQKKDEELYTFLNNITGFTDVNVSTIWRIADTFICEKAHNYTLVDWAEKPLKGSHNNMTVYDRVHGINDWEFGILFSGKKNRFHGGPLLKEYISNMQNRINGVLLPKLYMHSGHDTTVGALLTTLGLYEGLPSPPYAAMVGVELRQKPPGKYYVNVYYKNTTDTAYPLTIKGCTEDCPWEDFLNVTKDIIPSDWDQECGNTRSSSATQHKVFTTTTIVAIVLAALLLISLLALVITCVRSIRMRRDYGELRIST